MQDLFRGLVLLCLGVPALARRRPDKCSGLAPVARAGRNGVIAEAVAPWKGAPKVVWRQKVYQSFSSPIVADGIVFVHTCVKDKDIEEVIALDAATGKRRWHDTYPRAKYRSQLGAGPRPRRASPTASWSPTASRGARRVTKPAPARLWQVNPHESNKLTLPRFGVCSSPILTGGRAVVLVGGAGFAVAAYDLSNGKLAWKALDEPAGSASPTLLPGTSPGSEEQIVAQTTLRLAGLSPKDGKDPLGTAFGLRAVGSLADSVRRQ